MKRTARLAQWVVIASGILLLFWVAAAVGGWSPDLRRLTSTVHGPLMGDYRAEGPQILAPLSPEITKDASRDQATSRPRPTPPSGPSPSGSASPTPTGSGVLPTLPVATPTVPVVTPTLPAPTPPPTPTLPTPPQLF